MKFIIVAFVTLIAISGCMDKKALVCNCCEAPYNDVKTAMNCIDQNPTATSYDSRMLLLAFVDKKLEKDQSSSWNIIEDQDILKVAKRDYLLVILDVNNLSQIVKDSNELLGVINSHKNESQFFVIVNQAYYPFGDWKNDAEKSMIIGRLEVGNGP